MTRIQRILLVVLVVAVSFVAWITYRTRQPPVLPDDAEHRRFVNAETCLTCHEADGPRPQSSTHPVGLDCLRCHGSR